MAREPSCKPAIQIGNRAVIVLSVDGPDVTRPEFRLVLEIQTAPSPAQRRRRIPRRREVELGEAATGAPRRACSIRRSGIQSPAC